ncbi:Competence protein CoiA-like family protein [Planococcus glaciei]|uniref:competence protein CoiA family protein n=1 Tax=Planococcus glaciei TaxID=459472 RepID=UPI00087E7284|nr:competence protein CoiA family protein [Planococcus glaciei]SDH63808.1 Competence protein CoiA-like family protein [Planococcus glaciei]
MREAWHTNNEEMYIIPQNLNTTEIYNHKQIAKKGTFLCPYCNAKLYVKSGEIHGTYFSHLHGESCEESQKSELRYSKYEKQKHDETPRLPQILAVMKDELEVLSKVYPQITHSNGYLNSDFVTFVPDISLKINEHKYAITIVTNITSSTDISKAKNIKKQREYYTTLGYEALFFIERSNLGIDIDKHSLVLWESEKEALTTQTSDTLWEEFLIQLSPVSDLKLILNLPLADLNVKSIIYITPADQAIAIEAFHVLEQHNTTPLKAYFLSMPYTLSFSQAFKMENNILLLADLNNERENQTKYAENFQNAKKIYLEKLKLLELQQKEYDLEQTLKAEKQKKITSDKRKIMQENFRKNTYHSLEKEKRLEMLTKSYSQNNN